MDQLCSTEQAVILGSYFQLLWFSHNPTSVLYFSFSKYKTPVGVLDFDDYKIYYTPQGLYERLYNPLHTDYLSKYMQFVLYKGLYGDLNPKSAVLPALCILLQADGALQTQGVFLPSLPHHANAVQR